MFFRKKEKLQYIIKDISRITSKIKQFTEKKNMSGVVLEEKIAALDNHFKNQNQNKIEANMTINLQMNLLENELSLFKNKLGLLLNFVLKQRIKRFNPKRR